MKLKHIKIKPTIVKLKDLNSDQPSNGELFAEAMATQIRLVKGTEPIPTWATRGECLSINKRIIQDLLAARDPLRFEEIPKLVKCRGTKDFGDQESGIDWFVLPAADLAHVTDDTLICALNLETYYGGVGRFFRHAASVWRTKSRVLVQSYWGYDI